MNPATRVMIRTLVVALVVVVVVWARAAALRNTDSATIDEALDRVFVEHGVDRAGLRAESNKIAEIEAPIPAGDSFAELNQDLTRAIEGTGASVLDAVEQGAHPERPSELKIDFGRSGEVTHRVTLRPEGRTRASGDPEVPKIAIVFDDLGYSTEGLAGQLLLLDAPLTFAVLPGLPHSAAFAAAARANGHDVLLHLPMEPVDSHRHDPGEGALFVQLDADENRRRLRSHLESFSDYVGVSNHMGSRATTDEDLVDLVLEELRGRDRSLFFLDSRTTPYSIVGDRARRAGVRCASNNLFLDANEEAGATSTLQTHRLERLALRRGSAIAIGHVRPETVAAIETAVSRWRERGIQLVPLSDLMHR